MALNKDYPFTPAIRKVVKVVATNDNHRVPLTDESGKFSMILTPEQLDFIKLTNMSVDDSSNPAFRKLIELKYVVQNEVNGQWKLFPFAFAGEIIGIIQEKGLYRQVLSIGTNPFDSEAYRLQTATCNPHLLPHLFSTNTVDGVTFHIPLFKPGVTNLWSIRAEYTLDMFR